MKKLLIITFCIFGIFMVSQCGSGGGGSGGGGGGGDTPSVGNRIQNPIVENTVALGLSTFALGVAGKFPLEDSQTPEGIGYRSVAKLVRHIATNELYTFPERPDRAQIKSVLESFVNDGFLVTHEIHILSGPSLRKSRDPWVNGVAGKNVSDNEFVNMIQYDQNMRNAVQNLFSEVVVYATTLELSGINVLICPELEDNENRTTFEILIGMLAKAGWTDRTKIVRNGGSVGENGTRYESHNYGNLGKLRPGDIFNNDGNTFNMNNDVQKAPGSLTEDQMRNAINYTQNKGVIMFVWSDVFQGSTQVSPGNFANYPSFMVRDYVFKNPIGQASLLLGIQASEVIVK